MAKAKKTETPPAETVQDLVEKYIRLEKRSRMQFVDVQALLSQIVKQSKPGDTWDTKHGRVQLVDKLADKDTIFKSTAFNRYELKVVG